MESAHPDPAGSVLPHEGGDALLHLSGSLLGEGQRKDLSRGHAAGYGIGYPAGEHTGLPRSCAGYDEARAVDVANRLSLSLVQLVEYVVCAAFHGMQR